MSSYLRKASRPVHRCCCCTARGATSTICCRCGTCSPRMPPRCRFAAPCRRTGCRGSSGGYARASSTRTTFGDGLTSSPTSSGLRAAYGIEARSLVAVGFSNGANIASAMLLGRPEVLAGAVLFAAMVPYAEPPAADLAGVPVIISNGERDPMIPADHDRAAGRAVPGARRLGDRAVASRRASDRPSGAATDQAAPRDRASGVSRTLR